MFEFIVGVLQIFTLITIFISIPLLFIIRVITISIRKLHYKKALLVLFLPFSLGYYYYLKKEERIKYYNLIIIILTVVATIGVLFTIYQRIFNSY